MKKENVIKLAIEKLNSKIDSLDELIKKSEKEKQDAPSAMQSWSDTSRFQSGVMVDEMEKEKGRLIKHLDFLKTLPVENKTEVSLGSLVEVKSLENEKKDFYFISLSADVVLESGERVIKFISKDSPLAKSLLSKRVGQIVEIAIGSKNKEMEIVSIY